LSRRFDVYVEEGRRTLAYLSRYRELAEVVKDVVKKYCPDAEVYVFGSVLTGRYTASSDIDVLVVYRRMNEELKYKILVDVRKEVGMDAPLEVHFSTRREFLGWYSRFIERCELVR